MELTMQPPTKRSGSQDDPQPHACLDLVLLRLWMPYRRRKTAQPALQRCCRRGRTLVVGRPYEAVSMGSIRRHASGVERRRLPDQRPRRPTRIHGFEQKVLPVAVGGVFARHVSALLQP
eukprot:COSAG01_NODE_10760_length_2085_cov_6.781974_2_plen_118_part_01